MGYDKKREAGGLRWVLPRAAGPSWTVEWDVPAPDAAVAAVAGEIALTRGSTRAADRG
jgi:3-dehydroquinate synthase